LKLDHAQAQELFSAYWDDELPKEKAAALEEHLRTCESCKRELEAFEKSVSALGSVHKMAAPQAFREGVRDRIRRRSRGRFFGPRRLSQRLPLEILSLVMLGLVLAIYLVLQFMSPSSLKLP
jgi:anti-sigma factor RsiW